MCEFSQIKMFDLKSSKEAKLMNFKLKNMSYMPLCLYNLYNEFIVVCLAFVKVQIKHFYLRLLQVFWIITLKSQSTQS